MKPQDLPDEGHSAIRELLANFHSLAYPQMLVAKVTDASAEFLNTERKRGHIWANEVVKKGRAVYTGRGLIQAGLHHRLSWHFGPTSAAAILTDHEAHGLWLDKLPADKDLSWLDDAMFSTPEMVLEHGRAGLSSRPVQMAKLSNLMAETDADTGLAAIKVGECVATWAVKARLMMQDAA